MTDLQVITIKLRCGDREALRERFHPLPYQRVIRNLVSRLVDGYCSQTVPITDEDRAAIERLTQDVPE